MSENKMIDSLYRFFAFIIEWKYFDRIVSLISLANPISIAPQLYGVMVAENVEAVSVGMWTLFALIQITFALLGLKSKNLGMFLSMLLSVLISVSIIVTVLLKS